MRHTKLASDFIAEAAAHKKLKDRLNERESEVMASLNKVLLIGNLGKDPENHVTQSGLSVCSFSIATTDKWTDDNGQREKTEWHKIVVFGKLADNCKKYLSKGKSVYVQGKIQTRSWDDKATGQKRYATEIVADTVQFLSQKTAQTQEPVDEFIPDFM